MEDDLSPAEVAELARRGDVTLVDVRERYEWDAGRIKGARHVPLEQLGEAASELGGPVVFYCRVGARSAMATEAFRAAGLPARNMAGGLLAWERSGLPLEPEGGSVAAH